MTRLPLLLVCGLLVLAACDAPSAPDLDLRTAPYPDDARTTEVVLDYNGTAAKFDQRAATIDFAVPAVTADAYDVRVYFEETGTWAALPYTLAGDYCGDLIDLDFLFFPGTVQLRVIPHTLNPSTRILPPPTRLKIVVVAPAASS